ncbi:MAG: sulfotransferase domain-containing protein [Gammaproteobacteria bacterium]|nr:sulfotransferase domain-containing protein [Gammaproteobacteria bacterium]
MPLLSDRVKKILIIAVTAVLPQKQRVALRRSWLGKLELGIAQRSRLLMIAHPKSGNTWLKVMLSRLYQQRYQLPDNLLNKSDEYSRVHSDIPRLAASNGYYSYEGVIGDDLDISQSSSTLRDKPILFIARNPIDIAVSWYFQFTKRQSARKQELINHFIEHPIDRTTISMWDFVRHSDIGLPFLIDYLNGWHQRLQQCPNGLMIRYEDLRSQPGKTLSDIVNLMGETFSAEEIKDAVDYGSFDNQRKLESNGYFSQGGMTLRNADDKESFKTRRGKVGGYTDYFNAEQIRELEELMMTRLSPVFNYSPSGLSTSE